MLSNLPIWSIPLIILAVVGAVWLGRLVWGLVQVWNVDPWI